MGLGMAAQQVEGKNSNFQSFKSVPKTPKVGP